MIIPMLKTPAAVESHSLFDMINHYRFNAGQFETHFHELKFSGSDVRDFLQTQSTYDIDRLPDSSFQLITFLDPQGRVESYGWLTYHNKSFSYLVPKLLLERTKQRLHKFLISEDVEISVREDAPWWFQLGPAAAPDGFQGILFDERAFLTTTPSSAPFISPEDVEKWRSLSGWPSLDGHDFTLELLNNLRLYDLALVPNKGCYPGQETVSKIATRRGAAYSPVLIKINKTALPGELLSFDKRIGTASKSFEWNDEHYLCASLLRDFRVENLSLDFNLNGSHYHGVVKYYPLLHGDSLLKAREMYYQGSDLFKRDLLPEAEESFRIALKLDPSFADAYEALGVMLGRQERFQEAIDLMQELIQVDPKSVLAHTNMSLYLMRLGKITEAEEQKSLATIKSFQTFADVARMKEDEEKLKNQREAEWAQRESMFLQVLEIDPDDTLANYGLGSIAVERGDWEKARVHLERVLKQDAKYSVAYLSLGRALKGIGLREEAKSVWAEGVKVAAAKGDLMPANQMQQELNSL